MMKPDLNTKVINKQDDYLQSLSLKELKELSTEGEFLFRGEGDVVAEPNIKDINYCTIDELIQTTQLAELKIN